MKLLSPQLVYLVCGEIRRSRDSNSNPNAVLLTKDANQMAKTIIVDAKSGKFCDEDRNSRKQALSFRPLLRRGRKEARGWAGGRGLSALYRQTECECERGSRSAVCCVRLRREAARVPKSTLVLSPERASENHFFLSTNQDQDARVGGGAWRTDARHDCSGRGRMPPALESVLSGW